MKLFGISFAHTLPVKRAFAVLLAIAAFGFASASANQADAPSSAATTQKSAPNGRKQGVAAKPAPVAQPTAEQAPPPPPNWPANDHPTQATVEWNSHGLRIDAANSSLHDILKEVSTATGATVSGLGVDQRVFGTYGPGPTRDVISQLLDGTGYNVLMIGDQGQGTPRQIVLSRQPGGAASPSRNNNSSPSSDDNGSADAEEPPPPQPEPPPPPPQQPQTAPGPNAQPRTPQQILQEMQQRQQQIEQQQQQQRTNPQ